MGQLTFHWGPPVSARIARGPRATEKALLADVESRLNGAGVDLLERPLLLVVPSTSLLLHVQERLLRRRGMGIAGLDLQTHHSLAARIVAESGGPVGKGPDFLPLLARRFARAEPALSRPLEHLQDGYRSILLAVRDLLDAGLDPAHHEALEEALNAEGFRHRTSPSAARAHAVLRVAARTSAALTELGLERSSTLLERATQAVLDGAGRSASSVLVYGYSDATGLTIDFLQALLKRHGGVVYLDRPPDPADPTRLDLGEAFSRHFSERLLAQIPNPETPSVEPEKTRIEMFKALGGEAEVREVGRRIRRLLDAGAEPERIGVVARELHSYREAVRIQFSRLGIPYSGVGALGPRLPVGRRAAVILELMRTGAGTPVEHWLEARAPEALPAASFDLRVAFHAAGAGRLGEAAGLHLDNDGEDRLLSLPVCSGLGILESEDGESRQFARKRRIPRLALRQESERASAALVLLEPQDKTRPVRDHLTVLASLVVEHLGWNAEEDATSELLRLAGEATSGLEPLFEITDEEFAELLRDAWAKLEMPPLGGRGGGVQVLDVTEARARTFESLFILGMNRGRFPRAVHEDPVLPDLLRHALARTGHGVLPDLALKLDGFSEERYLFSQLLAASPHITLSWQEVDDDYVFQTPSPLIERLRWSSRGAEEESWKTPYTAHALLTTRPEPGASAEMQTAYESTILAGAFGGRDRRRFAELLGVALEESKLFAIKIADPEQLAARRVAILAEVDPRPGTRTGNAARKRLGPYHGTVGPALVEQDPRRREPVFVTRLERLAACPWQVFVNKILAIEPLPDPLEQLPTIEPRILGNLIHKVLEWITDIESAPKSLEEARAKEGTRVQWPDSPKLERMLRSAAAGIARSEGIGLPGFDRVLVDYGAEFLEQARLQDWSSGASRHPVLASEFRSELQWPAAQTRIGFRADRLDRIDDGLMLTDYKTGGSPFGKAQPKTIRKVIASGRTLQGMLYAVAAGTPADRGRYLYLKPEVVESKAPDIRLSPDDSSLVAAFTAAVNAALAAWRNGTFFPRLSEPTENKEPDTCRYCDVSEACLRGDSGARTRLRAWTDAAAAAGLENLEPDSILDSIARLWFLNVEPGGRR